MLNTRDRIDKLDISTDEEEIVRIVQSMRVEAEEAMEEWLKRTKIAYQFYFGNHWLDESGEIDTKAPSYRYRTSRDIIFSNIETLRPLMTDSRPRLFITPDYPQFDSQVAGAFTEIFQSDHERRMEDILLSQNIADLGICGKGYRKYTWDTEKDKSRSTVIQPWDILPDPYGTLPDFSDHKYVIHIQEKDADDVARIYNVDIDEIVKTSQPAYSLGGERGGLFSRMVRRMTGRTNNAYYIRHRVEVIECWFFGQLPIDIEHGENPSKAIKYPHGRVFVITGDKLLHMQENPYWHSKSPFIAFHDYLTSGDFLGFGEVQHLKDPQEAMDILLSQIVTNAVLMANQQWIYEEGTVPEGWLTNQPGLNIKVPRGMIDRIRKEPGRPMPAYVHQTLLDIERHSEKISAISEVSQGIQPSANTSGVAIAGLQQAALGRIRHKIRLLENSYRQAGAIEVSNYQQFANFFDPRTTKSHEMGEWLMWEERMRNLMYDIKIESQAELPHNLDGKLAFAFNMLDRGIFDIMEFLEFTKIPVSERLRERHEQMGGMPLNAEQGAESPTAAELGGIPNLGQGVRA